MITKIIGNIEKKMALDEKNVIDPSNITYVENELSSTRSYRAGDFIFVKSTNTLYKVTASIISPYISLVPNVNIKQTNVGKEFTKYNQTIYNNLEKDAGWYTLGTTPIPFNTVGYVRLTLTNPYSYRNPAMYLVEAIMGYNCWGKILTSKAYVNNTSASLLLDKIRIICTRNSTEPSYKTDIFSIQIHRQETTTGLENLETQIFDQMWRDIRFDPFINLNDSYVFYSSSDTPLGSDVVVTTASFTKES